MKIKVLFISILLSLLASNVFAADYSFIVAANSPMATASGVTKDLLGKLFLGKEKVFNGSGKIIIIERTDALKEIFHKDVTGMNADEVNKYWAKLVFTGKEVQPAEKNSDNDVIALIKGNQNAIGYINSSSVTAEVKVIPVN